MDGHPTVVVDITEVEDIYVLVSKVFIIINIAMRSSVPITMKNSNTKKLLREN